MSDIKKKHGDRKDGKRVKDLDAMHILMPFLMPNRCDCEVYLHETFDVTDLRAYLKQQPLSETEYRHTIFHVFLTAIAKTITYRPLLNRFIAGKRIYERDHVSLSFVVKRQFSDHAEESIMILNTDGNTTLDDVSRKIANEVHVVRENTKNNTDKLIDIFSKAPRWFLNIFMWLYRRLDYHGMAPKSLTENDPNFTTVLVSNLGSIGCNAIYHHLNNYGTNSILITIGELHKIENIDSHGNRSIRDVVNVGITLDERIADGFYFARSVRLLKYFIKNPELLEASLKEKNFDYKY